MKKECMIASSAWCFMLIAPWLMLKFSVQVDFGFMSFVYALVFFVLKDFTHIMPMQLAAIITFAAMVVLLISSVISIILSKGRKIHCVTIIATLGELILQLYTRLSSVEGNFYSFFSPFVTLLLLIWLISLKWREVNIANQEKKATN